MHSYHNVAELRHFRGAPPLAPGSQSTNHVITGASESRTRNDGRNSLAAAAVDLDIEVPDLLAQGVAVQTEQVGGADLIAAGGRERCGEQRYLNLLQDPVIEARRWHAVREAREVRGQIGLDRAAEIVDAGLNAAAGGYGGRRQLAVDDGGGDDVLRVERRQTPREVFQFAHIARPAMLFQPLQRLHIELLRRQPVLLGEREEVPDEIGQVLDALAQRR